MPMVKHCESRGCQGYPMYGFGSALKDSMRWACAAHRGLIGFKEIGGAEAVHAAAGAGEDGSGVQVVYPAPGRDRPPVAPSQASSPKQGRLFG